MKTYVLQAKIGPQVTTQAILARDDFSAKVLATHKINANHVADKRYAVGEISLKDPEGKVVWEIKAEEPTKLKKDKEVK